MGDYSAMLGFNQEPRFPVPRPLSVPWNRFHQEPVLVTTLVQSLPAKYPIDIAEEMESREERGSWGTGSLHLRFLGTGTG